MYASDLKHPQASLEEKLRRLYSLNRNHTIDLSFRPPYLALLERLGNPHLNLPPVIHVAGTNGKGSTIAMLRSILEAAGYKAHAYTSPHLRRFNERIVLAGQRIGDEALEALIDEVLALNAGAPLTFFEITTALAFAAFSRIPADIVLLETGLGGRLDCTNVIEAPLVAVITAVSHDHMEFLGEELAEIAAEKAGIMKRGAPCIIGAQSKAAIDDGVINVFESKAAALGVPLFCHDADWFARQEQGRICFTFAGEETFFPLPNLIGPHQLDNAGAVLATLAVIEGHLPRPVDRGAIERGLRAVQWAGRLQKLEPAHICAALPENWEIWLDGAHNPAAALALAAQAQHWGKTDPKPLHLVVGMMKHKDPAAFLAPLLPHCATLSVMPIPGEPQAHTPESLLNVLHNSIPGNQGKPHIYERAGIAEAVDGLVKRHGEAPGRILITGSLYLAGHILQAARITP